MCKTEAKYSLNIHVVILFTLIKTFIVNLKQSEFNMGVYGDWPPAGH